MLKLGKRYEYANLPPYLIDGDAPPSSGIEAANVRHDKHSNANATFFVPTIIHFHSLI
jgi:hypothetical protein